MRVLVATDQWSPDAIGGSARVATGTSLGFARAGHDVVVLAPATPGRPPAETADGVALERRIRRGRVPQSVGDVVETWRWARRQPRPDVLVSHQATGAVGLLLAHRGVPLLHVFHASAPLEERFIRRRLRGRARVESALLDPLLVLLERIAVRRARVVAVLSEYSAGLVRDRHPAAAARLAQVGGAVDVAHFAAGRRERGRELAGAADGDALLLTVRRLEPRMGVEELVRSTARLAADGHPVRLAVAGSGVMREPLERLAAELGIGERVRFLGRVPEDDLPHLYAGADLFVLPTVAYEGFGISTAEALAAGTPVVGTPVGATPELLAPLDPGLVAAGTGADELAAAIGRGLAASASGLRPRAAEYARSRFSWDAALGSWLDALQRAAKPS